MKRVLDKFEFNWKFNEDALIPCKAVFWTMEPTETKTTYKCTDLFFRVYINGKLHHTGGGRFSTRKPVSINKKTLRGSMFTDADFQRIFQKALNTAASEYLESLSNRKATVLHFDKVGGEGLLRMHDTGDIVPVYACNLKGAKTGFPETACVYLEEGSEVVVDYVHSHCGAIIRENFECVKFDREAWDSLDQNNLAFKTNEDDSFKNGLFK